MKRRAGDLESMFFGHIYCGRSLNEMQKQARMRPIRHTSRAISAWRQPRNENANEGSNLHSRYCVAKVLIAKCQLLIAKC